MLWGGNTLSLDIVPLTISVVAIDATDACCDAWNAVDGNRFQIRGCHHHVAHNYIVMVVAINSQVDEGCAIRAELPTCNAQHHNAVGAVAQTIDYHVVSICSDGIHLCFIQ